MDNPQAFKGVAEYYSRYRPGYPRAFFDYIVDKFNLDGTGRLLDIGCGTGQIAIPLSPHFVEVTGLDVSEDMLAEAKRQAEAKGVRNINWIQGAAEEISPSMGEFKLATIGYAFHWLKAGLVLEKLYEIITPGGGVVIAWDDLSPNNSPKAERWRDKQMEVADKYLDPNRAKKKIITLKENFELVLKSSPFRDIETYNYDYDKIWSIEEIIGRIYSSPGKSRQSFGDKGEDFERELTRELLKFEPSGKFTENLRVKALMGWKYYREDPSAS